MTTRIRKVITAIDADGKAFSEVHSETQVGERWFPNDPVSLDNAGPEAKEWQDLYGAAQSAQITSLTAERDSATETISKSESKHAEEIAALQSEIERLTGLIPAPLGPRKIWPRQLLARLTFAEVVAAIRTDDDAAIYAVANLQTLVDPVDLDSEETHNLIGALVLAGILTPERLAEVLA